MKLSVQATLLLITALITSTAQSAETLSAQQSLENVLEEHWQNASKEQVFYRTDPDTFRLNGELPDMSKQGRLRRQQYNQTILERLKGIDLTQLNPADQLTYRLFRYERQSEAKYYTQPDYLFPMNYYSGYHSYFAGAPNNMTFLSHKNYQDYLISLADFARYNEQHLNILKEAVERGYTHYCESFKNYHKTISKHVVDNPQDSLLYRPFIEMPETFTEQEKAKYRSQGLSLVQKVVIPEFQKLLGFFRQDYMSNCRKQAGIGSLEGGLDYYQYLIEYYTTTDMTAEQIHSLGLSEVKRIRVEMDTIIEQVGFEGSFEQFIQFLRTDPQFYASSERQLLEKASYITRKVAGQLPKWFMTLPRTTFDIQPSPNGGAYYVAADNTGTTSGTYFLDTKDLKAAPLYNLEALTLHEAEPGHHFETSLSSERALPEFRKTLYHSAYGEGWGLYAESLGKDMGFYQDRYSDFGRLTYEAWRASRLVVDTGIHAMGWTRQQAIDYLAANTALTMPEVIGQIDRYISWPGQALSYKLGELKIQSLRHQAQQKLGSQFDIRAFHEQILKNGSLPLDLLEELTLEWLEHQTAER